MEPVVSHRTQPHSAVVGAAGALMARRRACSSSSEWRRSPTSTARSRTPRARWAGWAYPAVAAFALLETGAFVGLLVPGETAVVVGGVVAAAGRRRADPDDRTRLAGGRGRRPHQLRDGSTPGMALRRAPRPATAPWPRPARSSRPLLRPSRRGKAVLLERFTGIVRAVSPFLAGASGLGLRRFVPWSLAGALLWAATFTAVGNGFSASFAESGESAARIALGAALVVALGFAAAAVLGLGSGGRRRGDEPCHAQREQRAEGTEAGAQERTGHHVEREVHAQVERERATAAAIPSAQGRSRGLMIATAVAAANAVALWPEGNEGLSGRGRASRARDRAQAGERGRTPPSGGRRRARPQRRPARPLRRRAAGACSGDPSTGRALRAAGPSPTRPRGSRRAP